MKQMTTALQIAELSPTSRKKLNDWLIENNYFSEIDGEKIPFVQLSIGQMIELLGTDGFANLYDGTVLEVEKLCDDLFEEVKRVLDSKN